jgi:hypothetical protein
VNAKVTRRLAKGKLDNHSKQYLGSTNHDRPFYSAN